jgi:AraC family transcriptional regulator
MLAAGSAPGESGIAILNLRFQGGLRFATTPRQHLICFQLSPQMRFDCRLADQRLRHDMPSGSLAICPAGIDCTAQADDNIDALVVAIEPGQFALAAAEESALEAQLIGRFSARDGVLLDRARILAAESTDNYPNGPLFWNEVASSFIDHLLNRHTTAVKSRTRGRLGTDVLKRLRDHVIANLADPIDIATLARLAGRSPFHFSRVFTRSVGVTPHRYVVHLRLRQAIAQMRDGQSGLAEIAARTGFADQSHLSRWVRRVHGVSLKQLLA